MRWSQRIRPPGLPPMTTDGVAVSAALTDITAQLRTAGCDTARLDARLLLAHATELSLTQQMREPARCLTIEAERRFRVAAALRARRIPLAQIIGEKEFWSLPIAVSPDVLIPRPDSEILIENVLRRLGDRRRGDLRVLDFGTGSGCLLLALLNELPTATGVGVDIFEAALAVASSNAARLGLSSRAHFVISDWNAAISGRFDIVIANPPYIRSPDLGELEPEIAHEPRLALDGGADGMAAYRKLLPCIHRCLTEHAVAAIEIGVDQAGSVASLAAAAGLPSPDICHDLAGRPRCLVWVRQTSLNQ